MGRFSLINPEHGLPRTQYEKMQLNLASYPGIWKYIDWLPVQKALPGFDGGCVTYLSSGLAEELGLKRLYIGFNGYWPQKGANLQTCSFKDLEAGPTVEMLNEREESRILTVASAGNTARAFASACADAGRPLLLVVPKKSLNKLWIHSNKNTNRIFLLSVDGDYSDAIAVSDKLCSNSNFIAEGGAKNIARRDGMGTVVLDCAITSGKLPDYYFQAVGSGTGGIAAWEASMRLIADGRFGNKLPKLRLAQNLPCAPLFNAVHGGTYDKNCPQGMKDAVLFNRRPPYDVSGGVAEALAATDGKILGITNNEAEEATKIFQKCEGIDIMGAASIAVAALISEYNKGNLCKEEMILLNITGGGESLYRKEQPISQICTDLTTNARDLNVNEIYNKIVEKLGA